MISQSSSLDNIQIPFDSNYLLKLQNIYFAENYCYKRLPGLVKKIPRNELWLLLDNHLYTIKVRKTRLENIFNDIKMAASGTSCVTFKSLIGKAGNIIYQSKFKEDKSISELISALLEISIYRSYIYNTLLQSTDPFEKSHNSAAIKNCLLEEDDFFHSLLRIKKYVFSNEANTSNSLSA